MKEQIEESLIGKLVEYFDEESLDEPQTLYLILHAKSNHGLLYLKYMYNKKIDDIILTKSSFRERWIVVA